jgi:hypothetical protein
MPAARVGHLPFADELAEVVHGVAGVCRGLAQSEKGAILGFEEGLKVPEDLIAKHGPSHRDASTAHRVRFPPPLGEEFVAGHVGPPGVCARE